MAHAQSKRDVHRRDTRKDFRDGIAQSKVILKHEAFNVVILLKYNLG